MTKEKEQLYFIWSFEKEWRTLEGKGAIHLGRAGKFTLEVAIELCNRANSKGKIEMCMVPVPENSDF